MSNARATGVIPCRRRGAEGTGPMHASTFPPSVSHAPLADPVQPPWRRLVPRPCTDWSTAGCRQCATALRASLPTPANRAPTSDAIQCHAARTFAIDRQFRQFGLQTSRVDARRHRVMAPGPVRQEDTMKTRAAVAVEKGKPLEIMEVDLEGPEPARCWSRSRPPASATPTSSRSRAPTRKACSPPSSGTRAPASSSTSARA